MIRKFAAFSGACCAALTLSCGSSDTSTHAGSSAGAGAASAGAPSTTGAGGSSGLAAAGGTLSSAGAAAAAAGNGAGVGGTTTGGAGGGSSAGGGSAGASASTTWRPFSDQSPWNTPIPSGTQPDAGSATMISDLSSIVGQSQFWINLQDYSVPVYWVDASTASVSVAADLGGTGFRTGAADDSVAAGTGLAPIPVGALPAAGTDKHLSIVDMAAHTEWGFWNANQPAAGWTAGEASTQDLSGDGVRPPEHDNPWWAGHGPRACGFGLIAGLITVNEIKAGAIEHALVMAYPHIRSRYYTPPASSAQGTTTDAIATRGILCGGRIQLDPALDLSTLGLSKAGLAIATALQKYGAFVGDYSGAVSLYAEASADAQAYFAGGQLDNATAQPIPLTSLRVLPIGMTYDNMN